MYISFVYPLKKMGLAPHQNQKPDIFVDLKGKFSLGWKPECEVWVARSWSFLTLV